MRVLSDLLGRLNVGKKLALIYLLDLSAVIFISSILIHEKFIAIDFSRKELAGNAYIQALRPSLVALAGAVVPGGEADGFADTALQSQQRHGPGMQGEDDNLAFRQSLRALRQGGSTKAQTAALERGRELVTRVGNQSNLILDPDLDSYYTMSVVLLRYPELLELVHRIGRRIEQQATSGRDWSSDERTQYFILEGRLDAIAKGTDADIKEAFAASDARLRDALQAHHDRVARRIDAFRAAARAALEAGVRDRGPVDAAQAALLADVDTAWAAAGRELDRLLDQRIAGFFGRMWLHLGTALAMLCAILTAVYFVARQISVPLARLADVADGVRRSGDRGVRAEWPSHDEIGRLVLAFNGMLDQLGKERALQEELTARTHAAAAQKDLVEAIPIPLIVTAVPGHEVLHVNEPGQRWLAGRQTDPWAVGLDSSVRARFFQQLADREAVNEFEVQWRANGGEAAWAVLSARRLRYQGQDAVLTAFSPINQIKSLEQRLELWAKVFEASSESIVIVDAGHRIVTVNRAFCRHTGYDPGEVIGDDLSFLVPGDEAGRALSKLWPVLKERQAWQGEVEIKRRNGTCYPAWLMISVVRHASGEVSHHICTSLDISDRKASQERIRFLAQHDVLTGLPNRSLCIERLGLAIAQAARDSHKVAVLFMDLDRFKTINDSLGHHVGDALLRSVSRRLLDGVRSGDTVSRLGGDEFIVVLDGVTGRDEVLEIVEKRLVPRIRERHDVDGAELHVSCSVGIALYPDDGSDIDEMMRHADVAMYQSKALGRDKTSFFTPALNERAQWRQRVDSLLRHAAERGELSLHYQPRVAARSGLVVGVEALLRWDSPELGSVGPAQFIPIAEETRLIVDLGHWVVDQAFRQQARWKADGLGEVPVSINLSAVQLRDDGLVPGLRAALERHGVDPRSVELELTESTLMETIDHTMAQLGALKALGLTLSIDDFGTGFSSLNYLNRLPIDRLKIDRSFVRDMLTDAGDAAITRAIIGLGHALGLAVVAEGVESAAIADTLRQADVDELQGHHLARPMTADALARWIADRRLSTAEAVAP